MICLRPAQQQARVRRAVQARGAIHLSLPGLRLAAMPDPVAAKAALQRALCSQALVFTSPAAVQFAARLAPLHTRASVFAVGSGTAGVLQRHEVQAIVPACEAMHAEGLLALPQWQGLKGRVGLVTAPGGRGVLAPTLAQRGFEVCLAEVYRRLPPRLDARHHAALLRSTAPRAVLISSAEALSAVLAALPPAARAPLLQALAVCSSARLIEQAQQAGFAKILPAPAATPEAMLQALVQHATDQPPHA